jgi:hypothetical protein
MNSGCSARIRRRDFVNGTAVAIAGAALGAGNPARALGLASAQGTGPPAEYYPPALTGMRVLACWNYLIPYLCPEMPSWQREALSYNVHTPNLWVNVWLRQWRPFHEAGVNFITIANTASGADDSTELAIDMTARAINELRLI